MSESTVLHEDAPDASVKLADGNVVRNLTAAEYEASYADGTPHVEGPGGDH